MVNVTTNSNCVDQTAYHVVWCPKERHDVWVSQVPAFLADTLNAICREHGWPAIAMAIQPDHIHLFLTIPPAIAVADAVKIPKGTSARQLFAAFPELKKRWWGGHLWAPSYCVGTAGHVSAETIRHSIARTAHVTQRR